MNRFRVNAIPSRRYALAVMAGLLLASSFPKIGIAGCAFLAPALMVGAALGTRGAERLRIGYVAGLTHYLVMLYWLLLIPYRWHGLPVAPAVGWLALSGVLALFPAVWVWLVCPVERHEPVAQSQIRGTRRTSWGLGEGRAGGWLGRTLWAMSGAAVWVAVEMVLARLLGGFPWDLLGVSQYRLLPLIQIASVTGVYGVSFLVAWVSLELFSAGLMLIRQPTLQSLWVREVFLPVLVMAVLFSVGLRSLRQETAPDRPTLKVALVQPSIPQTLIWDSEGGADRFRDLIRLSEQALSNRTDLVIWPEAAIPKMLRYHEETREAIADLARRHHTWLIVGSDDAEPRRKSANPDDTDYFNSSFLVSPDGRLVDRYVKRNLVIFGEYVPLQDWLPFLKWFTPVQGGFTPGTRPARFRLSELGVEVSVLICFEDVFPHLARADVGPATDLLVNITNDGWFDQSAAQWQHAATAVFRAVENRVPLIRCSNNGLTGWVDAQGRLRAVFRDDAGTIYGPGYLSLQIPCLAPGAKRELTFYTRHGDWFGWSCVGLAGVASLRRLRRYSRGAGHGDRRRPTEKAGPAAGASGGK